MKAKHFTKMVAWLLCVLMIAACLPVAALADTDFEGPIDVNEQELYTGENEIAVPSIEPYGLAQFTGNGGTYSISISAPEGYTAGMTIGGEDYYSDENNSVELIHDGVNPIVISEICLLDAEGNVVAGNVTINVVMLVEGLGTEAYPYWLEPGEITIPAGTTVYYKTMWGSNTLSVSGATGFSVSYDGTDYADESGIASLAISSDVNIGAPANLTITNSTDSDQTYTVSYEEIVEIGTSENPEIIDVGDHIVEVPQNNGYTNYCMEYTATKDGTLEFAFTGDGWYYSILNWTTYESLSGEAKYIEDGDGATPTLDVSAGDTVVIEVNSLAYDDAGWPESGGGTVTFSFNYKQEEVVFPTGNAELKFASRNMTFANAIRINMYVKPEVYEQYENVYVEYQLGGSSETIILSEPSRISPDDDRRIYDITGILPYRFDYTIKMTLHGTYKGVENQFVYEMKPLDYCVSNLKSHSDDANFRTLLVDLLNYATASQEYERNNNTPNVSETPINSVLTEEQKAWASTFAEPESLFNKAYEVIDSPEAEFKTVNILMRDSIQWTPSFTCSDMEGVTVKFRVGEKEWTVDEFGEDSKGRPKAVFDGLYAYQLAEPIYATVYRNGVAISNTLRYSISTYIKSNLSNDDATFVNLLKMIQCYGNSAYAYEMSQQ